jgi:putative restriction endonuclease
MVNSQVEWIQHFSVILSTKQSRGRHRFGAQVARNQETGMASNPLTRIARLSSAQFVKAFRKTGITDRQRQMLQVHLNAPQHTITAQNLAKAIGFKNWNAVNSHYGRFAGKLCDELNVHPFHNISILTVPANVDDAEEQLQLQLRPAVVEALSELGITTKPSSTQADPEAVAQHFEGAMNRVEISVYERNSAAREKCIAHYGSNCQVCEVNLGERYGGDFDSRIHVHHLKPLASIGKASRIDPIKDLRPVCPNCHAIIHSRQPPYRIAEMKKMLRGTAQARR